MKCIAPGVLLAEIRPAPQGAGGLKSISRAANNVAARPAPQGAGGLKFKVLIELCGCHVSRPARGGWIEIARFHAGGFVGRESRPARGGWIEIADARGKSKCSGVPPRKGRVD